MIVDAKTPMTPLDVERARAAAAALPRQLDPFDVTEVTRYGKQVPLLRWYLERALLTLEVDKSTPSQAESK